MKFYWTTRGIPELAGMPKPEQNRRWRQAYFRAFRRPRIWLAFVVLMATNLAASGLGILGTKGLTTNWLILAGAALAVLVGAVSFSQIIVWAVRPELARILAAEAADPAHNDGSYWVPPAS